MRWQVRYYTPDQLPVSDNFDSGNVHRTVWLHYEGAVAELDRLSRKWRSGVGFVSQTNPRAGDRVADGAPR